MTTCRIHGSGGEDGKRDGLKKLTLARFRDELTSLGGQIDVEPTEAMLTMVREAAFNVAYLRSLVEQLRGEIDGMDAFVIDEDGVGQVPVAWVGAGIAGRVDPDTWVSREHVLVGMYNSERDRLVKYAKMCRDAGVEERRVQIEEEQGRWLVRTLDMVLESLGLTEGQQQALPAIMGRVVEAIEAGGV